jgi:hypothetical protein
MRITLTRASIDMGDDGNAPHFAELDLPDDATLEQVLRAVDDSRYHHVHAGDWVTWVVYFGWTYRNESSHSLAILNHHRVAYLDDPNSRLTDLAVDGRADLYFDHEGGGDLQALRDRLLDGRETSAVGDFTQAGESLEE